MIEINVKFFSDLLKFIILSIGFYTAFNTSFTFSLILLVVLFFAFFRVIHENLDMGYDFALEDMGLDVEDDTFIDFKKDDYLEDDENKD